MNKFALPLMCFLLLSGRGEFARAGDTVGGAEGAKSGGAGSQIRNGSFDEGLNEWTFSEKARPYFSVQAASADAGPGKVLCYHNDTDQPSADFSFYQMVKFKANTYYRLKFRFKGDGKLAPMVLITGPREKVPVVRVFKVPAGDTWQTYSVEFRPSHEDVEWRLQFYPGSAPKYYYNDAGHAIAGRAGTFCFSDISLVETARRDARLPKGPLEVQTERFIYKKTDTTDLALFLDLPKGATGPLPVMMMIHGGGWANGSPETLSYEANFLAQRGIACVRIQYRLLKDGGTFPKTIGDVMDAVEWVRQSAGKYNLDLHRFGLTGGSAGGHLSAIAAQRTPECNVYAGFCGLYDAYEVGEGRFARNPKGLFLGPTEKDRKEASAIYQIKSSPPATILFHGLCDATIDADQAVRFAEALKKKGARVELLLNEGAGHDVGNNVVVHQHLLEFLNREWNMRMPYALPNQDETGAKPTK